MKVSTWIGLGLVWFSMAFSNLAFASKEWRLTVIYPDDEEKKYYLDENKKFSIPGVKTWTCIITPPVDSDDRTVRKDIMCMNSTAAFTAPLVCLKKGEEGSAAGLHFHDRKKLYRFVLHCSDT